MITATYIFKYPSSIAFVWSQHTCFHTVSQRKGDFSFRLLLTEFNILSKSHH